MPKQNCDLTNNIYKYCIQKININMITQEKSLMNSEIKMNCILKYNTAHTVMEKNKYS